MSFFEENRATDINLHEVLDALYGFFPDIEKKDVNFFYHGTYNVFEVKNQYIFRIPDKVFRNHKGIKLILDEIKMLHHLQKYISVSLPDPIFVSTDPDCPLMGYEKIDGIPLSKCFYRTTRNKKITVAKEIGEFLTELHSEELYQNALKNQVIEGNFSCNRYKRDWEDYFERIQKTIFHLLSSDQKRWLNNLFNNFLNKEGNFNFNYSIVHGDFDISNIVVNPKTLKINGIVDFEESRVYDSAVDFIFYDEGDFFLKEILSSYQGKVDTNFEERMKFFYGRGCLGYFEFGTENNIPDLVDAGFQILKKRMSRFRN